MSPTPAELLSSAHEASDPVEQQRLLREFLSAMPAWDGDRSLYVLDSEKSVSELLDAAMDFMTDKGRPPATESHWRQRAVIYAAVALAQLPGGLTAEDVTRAQWWIASAMETDEQTGKSLGRRLAASSTGSAMECIVGDTWPGHNKPKSEQWSEEEWAEFVSQMFRAGAALADTHDALKAGQRVGCDLRAESHLRKALELVTKAQPPSMRLAAGENP